VLSWERWRGWSCRDRAPSTSTAGGDGGGFSPFGPPPLLDQRSLMALSPSPTEINSMMFRIACPCGHVGIADAQTLPRSMTCSRCGSARHVEAADGARIVNRVAFEEWLFGAPGSPRVTERKL
jgi:hypothetical protein